MAVFSPADLLGWNGRRALCTREVDEKDFGVRAHPDDPETAMGGTICLLTAAGNEVVCVYTTRGQKGIPGRSLEEAAAIREKEAEAACRLIGARPLFMSQVDGASEITPEKYAEMKALFEREKPDVVFTHWPLDGHRDHCICGLLTLDAWRQLDVKIPLYFYEVQGNRYTSLFHPTDYVDITAVHKTKLEACYCHESQRLERVITDGQLQQERFRGNECGSRLGEAFVRFPESPSFF